MNTDESIFSPPIINLTILECKFCDLENGIGYCRDNKSNHIGM